jgi:hypothetical protein
VAFSRLLAGASALTALETCHRMPRECTTGCPENYSGFDSAPYRNVNAKWHFPQENATSHDLQMATRESKQL